jgi:ABC-2 type transport system ATP-binding protein
MRQRVKLAQAIAHEPELLILDEPFNGLDPVGRFEMTNYLKDWVRGGRSLILSSHVLHEVEAVNPSFLLVSGGRLLASGSPEDVRQMLADSPGKIVIRTDKPRLLASHLMRDCPVNHVRLGADEGTVEVLTESGLAIRTSLPGILKETGATVTELHSADESLRNLFSTLMRYHRGEG